MYMYHQKGFPKKEIINIVSRGCNGAIGPRALQKLLRVESEIGINLYYITVLWANLIVEKRKH